MMYAKVVVLSLYLNALYYERAALCLFQQALLRQLYGQVTLITGDPAATELFGNCRCYTAAAKAIKDEIMLFGGCQDDAFEQGSGLLRGVAIAFRVLLVKVADVGPDVSRRHNRIFIVGIEAPGRTN